MELKKHSEYTYDQILDKYNETKDKKFLSYAFIKSNNVEILRIMDMFKTDFIQTFLYVKNIQRELDGLEPYKNFNDIQNEFLPLMIYSMTMKRNMTFNYFKK